MTLSPRDAERARQFQANRNQTRQLQQGSTLLELNQLQTAMQHYRNKLIGALTANDTEAIQNYISQLIRLRATQCGLNLRYYREIGKTVNTDLVRTEQTAYITDCTRLIAVST